MAYVEHMNPHLNWRSRANSATITVLPHQPLPNDAHHDRTG